MTSPKAKSSSVTTANVYVHVNKLFYDVSTVQCNDIRGRNE